MNIKTLREAFVEFYGEDSRETSLLGKVDFGTSEITTEVAYKKLNAVLPDTEYLGEIFLGIECDEYENIKLNKRIVNNCMPCVNILDKSGKQQDFYKELIEKLQSVDSEHYTLSFVLNSVFNHFIAKYNANVESHNKFAEEYLAFLDKLKDSFSVNHIASETPFKNYGEQKNDKSGFVYIASGSEGFYKIGRTKNISDRESCLKTGNHFLKMFAYTMSCNPERLELLLHTYYKNKNVGGEWFEFTKEEVEDLITSFGFSIAIEEKAVTI